LNLAWRVGLPEEEVAQVFKEGTALAERSGDLGARARLLDSYGVAISAVAGRYREGLAHVEEALVLAEKTGDLGHRVALHFRLTYFHSVMGNPAEVLRVCERGMALAGGDIHLGADWTGFSPYLGLMSSRGLSLMFTGQLAEASAILARTEGLALERGDLEVAAVTGFFHTDTAVRSGETGAALRLAARVVELGERIASPIYRVYGSCALAQALVEAAEWDEAVAAAEGGLDILRRENRVIFLELQLVASLARARLGAGDHDRARAAAREALALCARFPDVRSSGLMAGAAAAHALLRTDGASEEALGALAQVESLAAAIPDRFFEASLRLERAELARLRRDEADRERLLVEAERLFTGMGATARAEQVAKELRA
jgi:tetratricopeptide (TPR) repeat protein